MSLSSKKSSISGSIKGPLERPYSVHVDDAKEAATESRGSEGLSYQMAGFFILAQLAGAGFLSLPQALANTGWLGLPMMFLFCGMVGFAASRLGHTWVMLEERWPEEYSTPARQPYMEMAYRAFGKVGRNITLFCVVFTQFGGTTVFIILAAETLYQLTEELSTCYYILIVTLVIIPCTWLGTPKDFWQGPALAVVSTIVAVLIIFVQTILDAGKQHYLQHTNPSVASFALGFGAVLFAFGGTSVFPTIQNDMKDRSEFWKSIILGFIIILSLYVPIAAAGYSVFGTDVDSNILFAITKTPAVKCAMALQVINLLGSYVIGFSTVTQAAEDIFNVPTSFGWKRVACRTSIVLCEMLVGLAIPDFSLVLNLIGGSTTTTCTFILPPLMYLKLAESGPEEKRKVIPLWMKIALIEIVIVGTVGGILATLSALYSILTTPFSQSCLSSFDQTG